MAVLVTGGAGYIGSHMVLRLADAGEEVVVLDNLVTGFDWAVDHRATLVQGNVGDMGFVGDIIAKHKITEIVHFAGSIVVPESVTDPLKYYGNNTAASRNLIEAAVKGGVRHFIFSSTAAVYGAGAGNGVAALNEDLPKDPTSPYGDTKLACERMIASQAAAFGITAVALRYFNAAGADPSGLIGEAHDPETHLIPLAIAAATGTGKPLTVFGDDFDTPDGTCLRDYIHVNDLASAHVAALEASLPVGAFEAVNVGNGQGRSVREVIEAVQQATGRAVPYSIGARRAGDPASLVADPSRGASLLGWKPQKSSLLQIVQDAAAWHRAQRYGRQAAPAPTPAAHPHVRVVAAN